MNKRSYIKVSKGHVEAMLDVFIYENDGFKIAYAPALDLMGYGKTVDDAKSSFEIVAEDFLDTALQGVQHRRWPAREPPGLREHPAGRTPESRCPAQGLRLRGPQTAGAHAARRRPHHLRRCHCPGA